VGHHWHVHRGWHNEFVLATFIYIIGFAILIALMVYVGSVGD
jgi:hypothetical protein